MRGRYRWTVLAGLLAASTAPAWSLPLCEPPAQYLAWPPEEPIWRLCAIRPRDSSGPAGSGLELRNVYFRNRRVLHRAQIPITAVDHPLPSSQQEPADGEPPDLCTGRCFPTWTRQEAPFAADRRVSPGYFESQSPVQTSCDRVPSPAASNRAPGRCPWGEALSCVEGFAAESEEDRWILTSEVAAAWYRYSLRWIFHRDGRIEARAGVQSDARSCARTPHTHHLLWRFDFDLSPLHRDRVTTPRGTVLGSEGVRRREIDGDAGWLVQDERSGRGYRLIPGAADEPQSTGDLAVTLYEAVSERAASACPVDLRELGHGRLLAGGDLVLWYRSAASISPQAPFRCTVLGPTLAPVGRWPLAGEVLFEDGFEGGDTSLWSTTAEP
ncbi:MAG: hypothetical protein AAF481_19790 [Acidobacteriota bacterium]